MHWRVDPLGGESGTGGTSANAGPSRSSAACRVNALPKHGGLRLVSAGLCALAIFGSGAACGSKLDDPALRHTTEPTLDADAAVPSASGTLWAPMLSATVPPATSTAKPVSTFVDVGCSRTPPAMTLSECDAFASVSGCASGEACVPFVDYPDQPCDPEIFGARCVNAGVGVQGDPCSFEGCAAGFLCVATGHGTRCALLCPLPGEDTCPAGLLCGGVDIEGYGVCF